MALLECYQCEVCGAKLIIAKNNAYICPICGIDYGYAFGRTDMAQENKPDPFSNTHYGDVIHGYNWLSAVQYNVKKASFLLRDEREMLFGRSYKIIDLVCDQLQLSHDLSYSILNRFKKMLPYVNTVALLGALLYDECRKRKNAIPVKVIVNTFIKTRHPISIRMVMDALLANNIKSQRFKAIDYFEMILSKVNDLAKEDEMNNITDYMRLMRIEVYSIYKQLKSFIEIHSKNPLVVVANIFYIAEKRMYLTNRISSRILTHEIITKMVGVSESSVVNNVNMYMKRLACVC